MERGGWKGRVGEGWKGEGGVGREGGGTVFAVH